MVQEQTKHTHTHTRTHTQRERERDNIGQITYECISTYTYSLVPGVSFDLFDSLYKPDAPKTTTVHVSDTRTDMLQQGG